MDSVFHRPTWNSYLYGAGVGLSGPIAAYVTDVSPPEKLEISMGLYRMISDLGFVVGPMLLGYFADLSVPATWTGTAENAPIGVLPFLVAAIIMVIAGIVMFKADDPVKRRNNLAHDQRFPEKESLSIE